MILTGEQVRQMASDACKRGTFKLVDAYDLLAIAKKEGGLQYAFKGNEDQFADNLRWAIRWTRLTVDEILGFMRLPDTMYAKFRLELTYWRKLEGKIPNRLERFWMSCSIGIGQLMVENLTAGKIDREKVRAFMADPRDQIIHIGRWLEPLIVKAGGNRERAYKAYNSGKLDSIDPSVVKYAHEVLTFREQFMVEVVK